VQKRFRRRPWSTSRRQKHRNPQESVGYERNFPPSVASSARMNVRPRSVGLLGLGVSAGVGALCAAIQFASGLSDSAAGSQFVENDHGVVVTSPTVEISDQAQQPFVRTPLSNEETLGEVIEVVETPQLMPSGPNEEGRRWTFASINPTFDDQPDWYSTGRIIQIGITNGHDSRLAEIELFPGDNNATVLALDEEDFGASYTRWTDVKGLVRISNRNLDERSLVAVDVRGTVRGEEAELHVCARLSISCFQPLQPVGLRITTR
jgi:hypothetical protein